MRKLKEESENLKIDEKSWIVPSIDLYDKRISVMLNHLIFKKNIKKEEIKRRNHMSSSLLLT